MSDGELRTYLVVYGGPWAADSGRIASAIEAVPGVVGVFRWTEGHCFVVGHVSARDVGNAIGGLAGRIDWFLALPTSRDDGAGLMPKVVRDLIHDPLEAMTELGFKVDPPPPTP